MLCATSGLRIMKSFCRQMWWTSSAKIMSRKLNRVFREIPRSQIRGLILTCRNSALLGTPVVSFLDESINALRVLRTPAFSGSSISVASHAKTFSSKTGEVPVKSRAASTKSTKIPRPPNAFILYRQHHHPKVKGAYPELSNNEICKFSLSGAILTQHTEKQ